MDEIVFDGRFRGPPESANGGYAAGLVARLLGGPASVRLRLPPPLDKPLTIERAGEGLLVLDDGATVIEAAPTEELEIDVPDPVGVEEATRAAERYAGFETHPFPTCFVCGPQRGEGDGLRVFPGPVEGRDLLASPWTPGRDLADETGSVRDEFVWGALDCPGGWTVGQSDDTPSVLGTMTARILGRVVPRETYVSTGWSIGAEGRKHLVGSALFTSRGALAAQARAVWIALPTS